MITTLRGTSHFDRDRIAAVRARYAPPAYDRSTLLNDRYLLADDGRHFIYYAPTDTWPSVDAQVIFVGLTPGFSQMQLAARTFTGEPGAGAGDAAAFAGKIRHGVALNGTMRGNLAKMIDTLALPKRLGLAQSGDVFGERTDIATTSALTYATFVGRAGAELHDARDLSEVPLFRMMLDACLRPRLACASRALVIPLGITASSAVEYLCHSGALAAERVLWGMPLPPGANDWHLRHFAPGA